MPSVLPPDEGFLFADRSGRSSSEIGVDRDAPPVLEVAEVWSGTLLDVVHVHREGRITLGDRDRRAARWVSTALTTVLVLGVCAAMVRHASLVEPPLLPPGDAERIEAWEARPAPNVQPAVELPTPGVELPPELLLRPDWEHLLSEVVLPEAARLSAAGALPSSWVRALSDIPPVYDVFEEPEIPRVAGDLPLGTRVLRDSEVLTIGAGARPGEVLLLGGRRPVVVREADELSLWVPDTAARDALVALHTRVSTLLWTQAERGGTARSRCLAAERNAVVMSWAIQATRARCAADHGDWEAFEAAAALAATLPTPELEPGRRNELQLALLEAGARHALLRAFPREGVVVAEAVPAAEAAHEALRGFVIRAQDAVALRSVDRGIHALAQHRLGEQRVVEVRRALAVGLLVLLLLPLAWRLDERRARRTGATFTVDGAALPADPFPLVDHGVVRLPVDVPFALRRDDLPVEDAGVIVDGVRSVELRDGDRLTATFGATTFLVHRVPAARNVVGLRRAEFDTLHLGVLAALLFVGASLGLFLARAGYDTTQQVVTVPEVPRIVVLPEQEKPKQAPSSKPIRDEANPGDKARGDDGRSGKPDAAKVAARASRVAVDKAAEDRRIAETAGLLPELAMLMNDRSMFGGGGLDDAITGMQGNPLAAAWGTQYGSRGHGARGSGPGGGGRAEYLGGWGTDGLPGGRGGERMGEYRSTKRTGGPEKQDDGIVFGGGLDKSIIDRVVKQNLAQFRYCYQRELQKTPDLAGKVVMKWTIDKSGAVSTAGVKRSSLGHALVEQCMTSRVRRLRFPAPRGGGIVMVSYPFVFTAR